LDAHAAAKAALAGQELKAKPLDVATWVGPGLKASLSSSANLALDALRSAKEGVRTNHTALAHRGSTLNNALETAAGVAEAEVLFYVTPKPLVVPAPEATGPTSNTSVALAQGEGGTAYANMRLRYRNTKYNGVRPGPASFYMPSTPKGLAETITDLNAASTRWVVRSGGHSYETNSLPSGTEAAVIDMARFGSLKIDAAAQTVTVGAGQRLGNVYIALASHDPPLVFASGTCAANGASGFLHGGGTGSFVRRLGWGSDGVVSAKAISAEGVAMVAEADNAAALPGQPVRPTDLLWALRGGGAGTAAVYEWTLRTYPAPERVVVCSQTFRAQQESDTAAFVSALFNVWKPASTLDPTKFPSCKFFFAGTDWNMVQLTSWDTSVDETKAVLADGMATAGTAVLPPDCRSFTSWYDYLVFMSIETYYGPDAAASVTPANFTSAYLLSADYLGWPLGGRAAPLSPFAPFTPVPEQGKEASRADGEPSPFSSQGPASYVPWTNATAAAVWAFQSKGLYTNGYVLGGAAGVFSGPAGEDGVGSAFSIRNPALSFLSIDIVLPDADGVMAADVLSEAIDATTGLAGLPSRFYNFINCYNGRYNSSQLYNMYFGDMASPRLRAIKSAADPEGRLTPWCDV